MLFNSWTFFAFLILTLVGYYVVPFSKDSRIVFQVGLLTVASYIFYAWHTPWLVVILATSTLVNAYATLRMLGTIEPAIRKQWLITAVIINLGLLAFFKYAALFVRTFMPGSWWSHWGFDLTQIPLPVGISFFTFQGISLVVDVYRADARGIDGLAPPANRTEFRSTFLRTAFFKAFFPQLVAGPIVKAHEFMHQIALKSFANVQWALAVRSLVLGYFLKMVVGDNLKEATAALSYPTFIDMPGINLLLLLYAYSFRIFADFAGYSLIAIGLAHLFGYKLPTNFNYPYLSHSITEFWRRWHISLSTWLKEYLYFPLGGNRRGVLGTYGNLIIVMLLGGLWHGAAWSYMAWGGAHGLLLAAERLFNNSFGGHLATCRQGRFGWIIGAAQVFLTFNVVSLLWLLFQLPRMDQVILYLRELSSWKPGFTPQLAYVVFVFGLPVVLYHFWGRFRTQLQAVRSEWSSNLGVIEDLAYAVMLFLIVTNSGSPGEFIYFQF